MVTGVWIDWLAAPRASTGITIDSSGAPPQRIGYEQVRELADAWRTSVGWNEAGRQASVLIVAAPCAALFSAFFGLLSGGADVCLIAPPAALADRDSYRRHLRAALDAVAPHLILCTDQCRAAVADAIGAAAPVDMSGGTGPVAAIRPAGGETVLAPLPANGSPDASAMRRVRLDRGGGPGDLLQLTSGSSGVARCVQLAPEAVAANIAAIASWLGVTPSDTGVTWLPLYHDMGLIGTCLMPISQQIDVHIMDPARFVGAPARYLSLFGRGPGTLTAMPPFGLELLSRRIRDADLAGMDLSGWRGVVVGAERIPLSVLDRFAARLEPAGFDGGALCPAYGMAEATVAITGSAPGEAPHATELPGAGGGSYVSCGRPLTGVSVRVVDPDGREVTGQPGEIVARSSGLARGYRGALGGSTRLAAGELQTGDAGFLAGGELHVIGRLGDAVKVRGTWLFAEDLEARIDHPAFRDGSAALAVGQDGDTVKVMLFRDRRTDLDTGALGHFLRVQGVTAAITVVPVTRRDILRTSSGKPRRRDMWLKFA
jgi:acyl-CoA synthetase (AMP-forming)/AMP-acid ligase II